MTWSLDAEDPESLKWADLLLGHVLRDNRADIPPEHMKWLRSFLRAKLSRSQYRLIGAGFGWLRTKPQSGVTRPMSFADWETRFETRDSLTPVTSQKSEQSVTDSPE